MSNKEKQKAPAPEREERTEGQTPEEQDTAPQTEEGQQSSAQENAAQEPPKQETQEPPKAESQGPSLEETIAAQQDRYLRLAAEYDNFRKRSQKEKESLWADAKADTVAAFLPVYDNLARAIQQSTADEAYKKGVEMTMNQLNEVLKKLGVEQIDALGQPFDPTVHNAVMHIEDEALGENTVAEVFQAGFKLGDKVIRCAMVKVAN